jgi:hypothetical protein
MRLTENDKQQLENLGITTDEFFRQLSLFDRPDFYLQLDRNATVNDGIFVFDKAEQLRFADIFKSSAANFSIAKFVPSSGAATRMFRDLFAFLENGYTNNHIENFFKQIKNYPFWPRLAMLLPSNRVDLVRKILTPEGLNYGYLPKAFIDFFLKDNIAYTPLYCHLAEAADYAYNKEGSVNLHFTFSENYLESAEKKLWNYLPQLEDTYAVEYEVKLSEQHSYTHTIAVDENNQPFRDERGFLIFRPGGHGSLIHNLSETEADFVFIRNIDNVLPPYNNSEVVFNEKFLGGVMLQFQQDIYHALNNYNTDEFVSLAQAVSKKWQLNICANNKDEWYNYLNRPMRVCGMVKNQGQPGGGPFWVMDKSGNCTLQIVESSQIESDSASENILRSSSYFNPVDLVCCFKNHKGEYFDLTQYIDNNAVFISEKSYKGKVLKALERPGLWNGAMAYWNSVFVEIPSSVFNPVKTVFDLLR